MDITTATPVEIDTLLADLQNKAYAAQDNLSRAVTSIRYAGGAKKVGWGRDERWTLTLEESEEAAQTAAQGTERPWEARDAQRAIDALAAARKALVDLAAEMAPLNAEFKRRGGWTRAFLAVTSNGHIHSSMHCSTCYDATRYYWFTALSGHDEAEIVTKSGSDACTICFPSAPVNDLKRPRSIFSDDEVAAQQAREARAAAKVARDAKKIEKALTADGSEFEVRYVWLRNSNGTHERRERFKTEQAAIQWVVQQICWGHGNDESAPAQREVIDAVARKHGRTVEQVNEMIAAKVAAKNKRDNRA